MALRPYAFLLLYLRSCQILGRPSCFSALPQSGDPTRVHALVQSLNARCLQIQYPAVLQWELGMTQVFELVFPGATGQRQGCVFDAAVYFCTRHVLEITATMSLHIHVTEWSCTRPVSVTAAMCSSCLTGRILPHMQASAGAQAGLAWTTYQHHVMARLSDMQATISPAIMEADFQRETGSHPLWLPAASAASEQPQPDAPAAHASATSAPSQTAKNIGPVAIDVPSSAASGPEADEASNSSQPGVAENGARDAAASLQGTETAAAEGEHSREGNEDGEVDFEMEVDAGAGAAVPSSSVPPVPEGRC